MTDKNPAKYIEKKRFARAIQKFLNFYYRPIFWFVFLFLSLSFVLSLSYSVWILYMSIDSRMNDDGAATFSSGVFVAVRFASTYSLEVV